MIVETNNAGKFSRVNLQSRVVPEENDQSGLDHPFLSILDSAYAEFDDSISVVGTHIVTIGEQKNLPLISYRWYQNINLWWIIGMYNGIADVWLDVMPGTVLQIPSLTSVESYFQRVKQNNAGVTSGSSIVRLP
jgi:hypothetical protein